MVEEAAKKETAKDRMITRVPTFQGSDSVGKAVEKLAKEKWESIDWVYILDNGRTLLGGVAIQKLLSASKDQPISSLLTKIPFNVSPQTDQEKVAILAIENDLQQIPVVDKSLKFLGVVPGNQIIDILHEEHLEDLLQSSGVAARRMGFAKLIGERIFSLFEARVPWLLLGLIGGFLATKIVSFFETSFSQEISLAFFIPIIVYMADAIGTQTQTIFIRTLTFAKVNVPKYISREIFLSTAIGLVCAFLTYLFSVFWLGSLKISLIVSISLFLAMATAPLLAIGIPLILYLAKKDPAIGSGPFTTIIQDIISLLIYFLVILSLF